MELRVKGDERSFPQILRETRESAHLSQVELAALLGVAPRTVQYWEAGRITPQPKHRRALTAFFSEANGAAA